MQQKALFSRLGMGAPYGRPLTALSDSLDRWRFIVLGAGAVGGVVGARLHQHGYAVTLVARGDHADALDDRGLTFTSPGDDVSLEIPVVRHPRELDIDSGDIVLLAVKSQDTVEALDALREVAHPDLPIASLQNGVDNERTALRRFENVYGVCVMLPATHLHPGVVSAHSTPITGLLDVGRFPDGVDDTARAISEAFAASSFSSRAVDDIMRWKYRKLVLNTVNAVQAVCGFEGAGAQLAALVTTEAEAVLDAAGIPVASRDEDRERRGSLMSGKPTGGERTGGGSSWQSLERRSGSIETDHLNGEIVLLGRLHGVPAPANELFQREAAELARDRGTPSSVDAGVLLDRLS